MINSLPITGMNKYDWDNIQTDFITPLNTSGFGGYQE